MTNQDQQPPATASGLGQVLAIVQAVTSLVPRWLVVAAGVILLTWLGLDLYLNLRIKMAEVTEVETQTFNPDAEYNFNTHKLEPRASTEQLEKSRKEAHASPDKAPLMMPLFLRKGLYVFFLLLSFPLTIIALLFLFSAPVLAFVFSFFGKRGEAMWGGYTRLFSIPLVPFITVAAVAFLLVNGLMMPVFGTDLILLTQGFLGCHDLPIVCSE